MTVLKKILPGMLLGAAALASSGVYASTAANTTIINTVDVFYQNATASVNYQATTSVGFTVNLVPAAPNVAVIDTAVTGGENSIVEISYTVTAGANGQDIYVFDTSTSGIVAGTDLSDATNISYSLVGTGGELPTNGNLILGGTTIAEELVSGSSIVMVPWDGVTAATNSSVNGLTAGDTIIIDGATYVIDNVDTSAADLYTNNRAIITLATSYAGANQAVGTVVGEQATIKLSFTTGTLDNNATSGEYTVTPDIEYGGGSGTTTPGQSTVTVLRPDAVIGKYVRNVTTDAAGIGAPITVAGVSYYSSGVSGKPTDVMEYLIHIDNTGGESTAENIIVSDTLPEFTSINASSVYFIAATDKDFASIVSGDWSVANPNDANTAAKLNGETLCIFAGLGGDKNSTQTTAGNCTGKGGILGPDTTATPVVPAQRSLIRFQVTID